MPRLILIRHGQSQWNLENRFTGWWDVDVTEKGAAEAFAAGELLKTKGMLPTTAFTSLQKRAIKTLHLALEAAGRIWISRGRRLAAHRAALWRADRARQGGDSRQARRRTGQGLAAQLRYRPPPPLEAGSDFDLASDPRYAGIAIPNTESLKDTIARACCRAGTRRSPRRCAAVRR